MRRFLIGLMGAPGSGKDETANILADQFGYTKAWFARNLKWRAARALFAAFGPIDGCTEPSHWLAIMEQSKRNDPTSQEGWARPLLESIGSAGRDRLGNDFWLRQVALEPGVVIPDTRIRNEVDAIRDRGGVIWLVNRPGCTGTDHVSDQYRRVVVPDATIDNSGDLAHLAFVVQQLMRGLQ